MYFFVNLTHLDLCQFVIDQIQPRLSLFYCLDKILFRLQKRHKWFLVLGPFELRHFGLDLCVELSDIFIFLRNKCLDGIPSLLQFHLNNINIFYLIINLFLRSPLSFRLGLSVDTNSTHKSLLLI